MESIISIICSYVEHAVVYYHNILDILKLDLPVIGSHLYFVIGPVFSARFPDLAWSVFHVALRNHLSPQGVVMVNSTEARRT